MPTFAMPTTVGYGFGARRWRSVLPHCGGRGFDPWA